MAWIGTADSAVLTCQVPRSLNAEVASLLRRLHPVVQPDRRVEQRTPIPFLFELSPSNQEPPELLSHSMVVVGKDITERGIAFYHDQPIPYRRAVLSIDLPDECLVELEVDLLWCRFTSVGWYESGGRLMGVHNLPLAMNEAG